MQHEPSEGGRKAKLIALLDRARENRGLQPETSDASTDQSEPPPVVKNEVASVPSGSEIRDQSQIQEQEPQNGYKEPKKTFLDNVQIKEEKQTPLFLGRQDEVLPSTSSETSGQSSGSHSRASSVSTVAQATGDDERTELRRLPDNSKSEERPHRVAVLNTTSKPGTAVLTGIRHEVPRLQQLKPLHVPRNNQQAQEEEKVFARELPPRTQSMPSRKNVSPTSATTSLKKLSLLTPDEYEDAELHSDFVHMVHMLIPSNATGALLERRGQPIQSISQQADCTLSIREPEASPYKDDRLLRIYGKVKCICLAQQLVIAHIRAYRSEKRDPNYMDLSGEKLPVPLPATSITKAMSVAVSSGKGGKKKAELEITNPFTWMVQREEVGKMMGRQGSILASIRRDTGAAIHLDEDVVPGTNERRVIVSGSLDSIAAAVEAIKSRSGGRPEVAPSVANGRLGQYFAIPYHAAGYLIGPQGSTVKSITERSGARLQLPSPEDLPLGSVNRILHMQGTPKQAEHAQRIVSGKLRDYLASSKCSKTITPPLTGRNGDKVTVKVLLSSRICAFMLDRRGKLIREISEKSGAHTHFLAPHDDENRICVYTGDLSCVLRAQRLVLQIVAGDAISSKHIAPPRKRKRSQRDEVEEYDEEEDENEYVDEEEPYYEDEDDRDYYDEEYEVPPRPIPRREQVVRRLPIDRSRHDYDAQHEEYDYDAQHEEYDYDDDIMDDVEYEERPRQPTRRRPVPTRQREYYEDEYALDEYDHNEPMDYDVPRPRVARRPAPVRRQTAGSRRNAYDEAGYDYDYNDEYGYEDDYDVEYEQLLLPKKLVRRRPIRGDARRLPVVLPGRKVQMVMPAPSPREPRLRGNPGEQRRMSGSTRPRASINRNGSTSFRQGTPRGGRGNGRPSSSRGRGRPNDKKRRRQ